MSFFPVVPLRPPQGEALYDVAGEHIFIPLRRVRSVSVVAVGSGLGDGGTELSASGNSHFNEQVVGFGSVNRTGGGYIGTFGGKGGDGGTLKDTSSSAAAGGGGGGAGGYVGDGGFGGNGSANTAGYLFRAGGGGGGVGIFGQGASGLGSGVTSAPSGGGGAGGTGAINNGTTREFGTQGQGGSGGTPAEPGTSTSMAGTYGGGEGARTRVDAPGGGGLGWSNNIPVLPGVIYPVKVGGNGAVRIVWPGRKRQFPSLKVGPLE